jgi:hypothetical protein
MARNFIFSYPGDPPFPAELLSIEEFLEKYPRTGTTVKNLRTGQTDFYPMRPDEIRCDLCNQRPKEEVLAIRGSRAYCEECAAEKKQYLEECK